ncbi:MAG: phosphopentomutase [Armatimonadetes bacterium]|nr:phosphopentomutase [Armatimonadota bacterium]
MNRVILIVLDSVGIGELPDANLYNDQGSDTLGNLAKAAGGLNLPHLKELGLGNIHKISGVEEVISPLACYGKMQEASCGKDTAAGHWEIAGIITKKPFPLYPQGFPEDLIINFEKKIGLKVLGNIPSSGTKIIQDLGEEHLKTGCPIVYTSADSVFQIAAHEETIPLIKLYEICEIARNLLIDEHAVCRVIARPFLGKGKNFYRTANRKDFSLSPPSDTLLDLASSQGMKVIGVGKIEDIFAGRGITKSYHTKANLETLEQTLKLIREKEKGIVFINLVDFDMLYGHRNDILGYAKCLEEFDNFLPKVLEALKLDDLLIITADHGCDPTTLSTDHSREYVPLLVYGKGIKTGVYLGIRETFADIASTVLEVLNLKGSLGGKSFLKEIEGI